MTTTNTTELHLNGVELKVTYTMYSESETGYNCVEEINEVRYNGRDVTDLIEALGALDQIKDAV